MPSFSKNTESEVVGPASPASDSVVRSAGVVSIAIAMSRVTGLIRESVMSRLFGAGAVMDAFNLGFRIPNLTRDLFAEGALSSAFVPTFTDYLTTKSKGEAARLANLVATALILVVGGLCVLGVIFAPALVRLLAPGFEEVPGKFPLAVTMTRIMFPFLLLVALAAQAMGILNACNQFFVPAMASTFFNIGSVGFGILIGYVPGHGHRSCLRRRASARLANSKPSSRRLSVPSGAALVASGVGAHSSIDGSGDSGQCRDAN